MYLSNREGYAYWVLDIEANGLNPDRIWCMVVKKLGEGVPLRLVGHKAIIEWFDSIDKDHTVLVGHNAVSYDVPVLNSILGVAVSPDLVVDTQVLSFLFYPKLKGGHSLAAYGERFGLPKVGAGIEQWAVFEPIMVDRCQRDVEITERLLVDIRKRMLVIGFSELSCQIEHGVRQAVDWQEGNGFDFDVEGATKFLKEMTDKEEVLAKVVHDYFPPQLKVEKVLQYRVKLDGTEGKFCREARGKYPRVEVDMNAGTMTCYQLYPFNLASPKQRVQRMLDIGYVPINFTKKTKKGGGGNPMVDEDGLNAYLEDCSEDVKPSVKAMAEWLVVNSRAKMVQTWLSAVGPDGAIHGTVWTCGAGSRRCTHTDPNTANIPSGEAPYGHECRSFWRARKGRVLLGCDAKAIQMRMFAHRLGNYDVGMQYVEGDPHQRNADAAGVPRKKVKNCFYAMIFGAQDLKLGKTAYGGAGTAQQGTAIRKALYATTPGLEGLFQSAQRSYDENSGWMQLMDGGWVRCPSPHAAANYWIQGDEAVLMKMVVVRVWREIIRLGLDALQVGFIHDEVQYDCVDRETAEHVARIFKTAIAKCGEYLKFIIPMAGDDKYGTSWAETH